MYIRNSMRAQSPTAAMSCSLVGVGVLCCVGIIVNVYGFHKCNMGVSGRLLFKWLLISGWGKFCAEGPPSI